MLLMFLALLLPPSPPAPPPPHLTLQQSKTQLLPSTQRHAKMGTDIYTWHRSKFGYNLGKLNSKCSGMAKGRQTTTPPEQHKEN